MGVFAIPAFALSYGLLVWLQLVVFFSLSGSLENEREPTIIKGIKAFMDDKTTYLALTFFVVSNGFSFVNDFLFNNQYQQRTLNVQFMEPFPRVFATQFVVFVGLIFYKDSQNAMFVLYFLTTIKITVELFLHQHSEFEIQDLT